MRPERADIAAPELPGGVRWLNADEPPSMAAMSAAGPVLVHFLDYAQLNGVRALPYVLEWRRRYAPLGLGVVAIHSSRFPFTAQRENVSRGVKALGIEHPLAIDENYVIWADYGCRGWPSLFLFAEGGALRWAHFGEGEYRASEEAIQEELRSADVTVELPAPMEPLRPSDAPGALVTPPSAEIFPGGGADKPLEGGGEALRIDYAAGGAHATVDGEGTLRVSLDGAEPTVIEVDAGGLLELTNHPRHEQHSLELSASARLRLWSVSFSAAVP